MSLFALFKPVLGVYIHHLSILSRCHFQHGLDDGILESDSQSSSAIPGLIVSP